jgi:hypothetical protein
MTRKGIFNLKENDTEEIAISADEISEIVPDADFRFSLVILQNGEKHFICGTENQVREKLGLPPVPLTP